MLFDGGFSDDLRFGEMSYMVHPLTCQALGELGIDDDLDPGPVTAREQRLVAVRERTAQE
jgi:hypothetical protein